MEEILERQLFETELLQYFLQLRKLSRSACGSYLVQACST